MKIKTINNLKKNITVPINGKLLKVGVFNSNPSINIVITSVFEETIIKQTLKKGASVFYPRRIINESGEYLNLDFYYLGNIYIEFEGLAENEKINNITFYYE